MMAVGAMLRMYILQRVVGSLSRVLGSRPAWICMRRRIFPTVVLRMEPRDQEWSRGSSWEGVAKTPFRMENRGWAGGTLGGVGEGSRLGNSSSVRAREAVRMAEWKLFHFLHRGYCKTGVSLEETVRSSILDMLGLRFLWDFSVHSFLPQALVILGVYEREGCVWSPSQSF